MLLIFAWCLGLVSFCSCITHWHVTESGRIESKEDSPYTLLRPYDLAAFLKQVHRIERLESLKEIISSKEMPKSADVLGSKSKIASLCCAWTIFKFNFWLFLFKDDAQSVDSYQEKFYKTDSDCIKASQQLSKFTFFETNFINWEEEKFAFAKEILKIKKSDVITFKKPYCDKIELGFRLDKSFDHLNVGLLVF